MKIYYTLPNSDGCFGPISGSFITASLTSANFGSSPTLVKDNFRDPFSRDIFLWLSFCRASFKSFSRESISWHLFSSLSISCSFIAFNYIWIKHDLFFVICLNKLLFISSMLIGVKSYLYMKRLYESNCIRPLRKSTVRVLWWCNV